MIVWILAVILIILLLLLLAPLKVVSEYDEKKFKLNVYLYGVKVFSLKKKDAASSASPEEKAEKVKKKSEDVALKISDILKLSKTTLRLLKKYVSVTLIKLDIIIGTGDAATTAVNTGALWAAVYGLIGVIGRIVYIDSHKVNISPDYAQSIFDIKGKCIIKSRVVYIIIIAITILMKFNTLKRARRS